MIPIVSEAPLFPLLPRLLRPRLYIPTLQEMEAVSLYVGPLDSTTISSLLFIAFSILRSLPSGQVIGGQGG